MSKVFVLDTNRQPLNPVHPGRARVLLSQKKAAVYRHAPFTIILKQGVPDPRLSPLRLKIDPGAKTTGLAIVNDATGEVVWAADLVHRGFAVKKLMDARRGLRRARRCRKVRHRQPRWRNRRAKYQNADRLPPSLQSRLANTMTWVHRLRRWCPITALSFESVRFDTQLMDNPDISGVEYQQGTLWGYEVGEYLLDHWGRKCAYCGATDCLLEKEHIIPRSRGGSDRISNLCLACHSCNEEKGTMTAAEFGHPKVQMHAKASLRDAAMMNATRKALWRHLQDEQLPLESGSGGRTKFNRLARGLPKAHWIDAACVGASTPEHLDLRHVRPLKIVAAGRGSRKMASQKDVAGVPRAHRQRVRCVDGFRLGDTVRALRPRAKNNKRVQGQLRTVKADHNARIGLVSVRLRHCRLLQKADGYIYSNTLPL